MGFLLALIVGLAIAGFALFCFVLYWAMMVILIGLGLVFLFWLYTFIHFFPDEYIAFPCAVVATGLTVWAFVAFTEYSDNKKNPSGG